MQFDQVSLLNLPAQTDSWCLRCYLRKKKNVQMLKFLVFRELDQIYCLKEFCSTGTFVMHIHLFLYLLFHNKNDRPFSTRYTGNTTTCTFTGHNYGN